VWMEMYHLIWPKEYYVEQAEQQISGLAVP